MGPELGDQSAVLMARNFPRTARDRFGRKRAAVLEVTHVILDGGKGNGEGASGAGFGHSSLDRSHNSLAQIC